MAEVFVFGQVRGASGFPQRSLFCTWEAIHGAGWRLLRGAGDGRTHVDAPAPDHDVTWAHPLDMHFAVQSMQGWPKLGFKVYHQDDFGRNELYGYGVCHIPMSPGSHTLECACCQPSTSGIESFYQSLVGGSLQLKSDDAVHTQVDRFKLKTKTMGTVHVQLNIVTRGFEAYGIEM
ncbi:B9 domain-containing protein 2 [Salpingoeca rosetta]|uniref:B9 domain-containing protein 2 n=1 Tax=Salpingoeca rosetta (strain ATCC 50818 / BSB-021) TaxID=946362 RepID=F2U367_SALR5|nr:B9 domain-containing protein 2 [Salpingoeca rosetta]EGD82061.1 B9 domain-containing protein 2 [Salpingoeca rosetta]|eukprot:XP_004996244.1 B9 domain-containing protein 2 [Salpingoeca rosetta]